MFEMSRDELIERLTRLDEDASLLFNDDRRFHMVIVGGSALILLDVISRATHDIDALNVSSDIRGLLERYDINCRVMTYINNFPYNYEDRLIPLPIQGQKIDFYTASLEDIVIAKLFSNRGTDHMDLESPEVIAALDWDKLARLANDDNEVKINALNDRNYADFKANYDEYARRFKPCGN